MISDKQKECPKCGKAVPKTWKSHFGCGWKEGESPGTNSTADAVNTSGTISSTGAANLQEKYWREKEERKRREINRSVAMNCAAQIVSSLKIEYIETGKPLSEITIKIAEKLEEWLDR